VGCGAWAVCGRSGRAAVVDNVDVANLARGASANTGAASGGYVNGSLLPRNRVMHDWAECGGSHAQLKR
jgi:hypothetical protein